MAHAKTTKPKNKTVRVSFGYRHPKGICFQKTRWGGCCCQCIYHGMVYKLCGHSPKRKDCVCSEPLNFYVCTVFHTLHGTGMAGTGTRIHLIGAHGFCEMYTPMPKECTAENLQNLVLDYNSWWYKNCRIQRRKGAKICGECPFRSTIEKLEKEFKKLNP